MRFEETLADRSSWPIEQTMKVVGSRNAMLIMREAFHGTTGFEDFMDRVGMSSATAASSLEALTYAGLLERRLYPEQGERAGQEYILTAAGTDLMPVIIGLFAWEVRRGRLHARVETVHAGCGEPAEVEVRCGVGHPVTSEDVELRVRPTEKDGRR